MNVSDYLEAWIRYRFARLEAQNGVDEYKAMLLSPIRRFVETSLATALPKVVDKVPVVLMHTDMGLHNVIVSPDYPFESRAVIDWEFTSCMPFLTAVPDLIQPMFREREATESGSWKGKEQLTTAFWDAIPEWKAHKISKEGQLFLQWYEFGIYLKANAFLNFDAPLDEKMAFWHKNVAVVTKFPRDWISTEPAL